MMVIKVCGDEVPEADGKDDEKRYSGQWYNQWTTMPMPGVGLTPFSSIPHQPPAETKKDPGLCRIELSQYVFS
ncbi:unnamed protein product [Nippostrongylus brasiliensis]|uniref:Uncharacterized protein n=1 Tax=Nippostrongylus brasiliensis TaxID=27835 RepID=A0A0N4XU14_NIPBR|nr:unnamed protein product [Nippostrongylus brasiliensis]